MKTIGETKWMSLLEHDGYTWAHEKRCNGRIVACLPFKHSMGEIDKSINISDQKYYLIRKELCPPWGWKKHYCALTGSVDEVYLDSVIIKELKEEAGIDFTGKTPEKELIDLGTCFCSKGMDTIYHLFSIDLTHYKEKEELKQPDSFFEEQSESIWIEDKFLEFGGIDIVDPLVYTMYMRLKQIKC